MNKLFFKRNASWRVMDGFSSAGALLVGLSSSGSRSPSETERACGAGESGCCVGLYEMFSVWPSASGAGGAMKESVPPDSSKCDKSLCKGENVLDCSVTSPSSSLLLWATRSDWMMP